MMLVLVMAFLAFLALLHDFLLARVKKGPPASCHCFWGGEGSEVKGRKRTLFIFGPTHGDGIYVLNGWLDLL